MGGCVNCGFHPIRDAVEKLKDWLGLNSGGCGYHPGPSATDAHTKKIGDELAEMRKKMEDSSEKIEQGIIEDINASIYDLIALLERENKKMYGGKSLNINIEALRKNNDDLQKEVVGYIADRLADRLVINDKDLSIILEEPNDEKRATNFDSFVLRVQRDAINGLVLKIESTVRKQEAMIRSEIAARLSEVDRNMKNATKAYTDIVEIKEKDESKMAETQIKYIYQYELSEILLDQLGG